VSRRRGRAAAAGIAALLTLAVLVIGLPLALYRLGGSPLPSHLPTGSQVSRALLHRDSASLVLAAVRDVSWVAWALFTVAVLAEAQAVIRRRTAPRLWLGGLQGTAGRLVALAALTFTAAPVGTLLAMPPPVSAAVAIAPQAEVTSLAAPPAAPPAAPVPQVRTMALDTSATAAGPASQGEHMGFLQLVTVRPGDCLWTIAQHYLGSGDRFREIVALNLGHDMGSGEVFTNPSLIQPGWVLHLPASPAGTAPAPPATPGGGHAGHPGGSGQFSHPHKGATPAPLPGPASAAPASGAPASTAPASTAPAGTAPASPAPALPAPFRTAPASPAAGRSTVTRDVSHATLTAARESRLPLAAAFGTGVLAGGVAVSLARMRHRQRQTRRRGRRIPLPSSAPVAEAERRLHVAAVTEPVTALRGVLSNLAAALVARPQQMPEITALVVQPDSLEVLLASPAAEPPPAPFHVPGGRQGMAWQLGLDEDPPGLVDGVGDLLPGLLTVGSCADGYLLVDLEHLQVTTVAGPAGLTAAMLRSAAAELATGQLAGWYDLILVGYPELAALGGRGSCCDSLDAGLDLLAAKAVALRRRLGEAPMADVRYHRLADPADEDWALTLLVSAVPPTSGQLALLADLSADPGGIAALVPGGAPAPSGHRPPATIDLSAAPDGGDGILAQIWPLQLEARPQALDDADYEALTSLFATAAEAHDVGPADSPYDRWTWPPDLASRVGPGAGDDGDDLYLDDDNLGDDDVSSHYRGDAGPVDADAGEDGGPPPGGPDADDPWAADAAAVDESHWAAPDWGTASLVAEPLTADPLTVDPDWDGESAWAPETPPASPAVQTDPAGPSASGDDGLADPAVTGLPGEPAAWLSDPAPAGPGSGPPAGPAEPADRPAEGQPEDGPRRDAEQSLRIGVLGTFTINGQPGALLPAQSQLVLALALNGTSGLSNQQLCYLLGADPDRPKPSDSLRQLIVRTRRQLGRAPDRREWIEHLGGGQYALHPAARFDWHEFDALATEGMRARDAVRLRRALGLIRGRPFTGCYYWWLDLALTETVRAQIVDAADVLAALELAGGDPAAAARAARVGLAGDAGAEQLWRALMRAEHAAGNLTGVREAWSRCLDAISEIAPDGEPHPGTAALYRELLGDTPARPVWAGG
jgi:DNA-binding SARP family transcriptional activator